MKKLEELGISPAPWRFRCEIAEYPTVWCAENYHVTTQKYLKDEHREIPDARLIAAAPELYEALRGLLEIVCVDCKSTYEVSGKCAKCPKVIAAEKALAKAAGEEVSNG